MKNNFWRCNKIIVSATLGSSGTLEPAAAGYRKRGAYICLDSSGTLEPAAVAVIVSVTLTFV